MRTAAAVAATASLLLACASCSSRPAALKGAPDGTYQGHATYRGTRLGFSVRFRSDNDTLRAYFNSDDMLLLGQPLDSVRYARPRIRFVTSGDHPLAFSGVVAGDSIVGEANAPPVPGVIDSAAAAGAERVRFTLRHAIVPPPPYATERVTFASSDSVRLEGTVYLPPAMPHTSPGVVILQGSSSNLRHEYRFYADHFARAGFAVLVFDKRGKGESTGDYGTATYDDLANDAAAAVKCLRAQAQVVSARVGVWGLSQGAFITPRVAARVDSLAFVVAVSPPGMTIGETAAYQDSVRLMQGGFGNEQAQKAAALDRLILAWLSQRRGREVVERELEHVADTPWRRASSLPHHLPHGETLEGWYWRGRTLDPLPGWRALKAPALVVFGAADELLPAGASATNIARALAEGGNRDHTVKQFPAANHVLLTLPLVAGGAWDWPRVAPGYLDLVTQWMTAHVKP